MSTRLDSKRGNVYQSTDHNFEYVFEITFPPHKTTRTFKIERCTLCGCLAFTRDNHETLYLPHWADKMNQAKALKPSCSWLPAHGLDLLSNQAKIDHYLHDALIEYKATEERDFQLFTHPAIHHLALEE